MSNEDNIPINIQPVKIMKISTQSILCNLFAKNSLQLALNKDYFYECHCGHVYTSKFTLYMICIEQVYIHNIRSGWKIK